MTNQQNSTYSSNADEPINSAADAGGQILDSQAQIGESSGDVIIRERKKSRKKKKNTRKAKSGLPTAARVVIIIVAVLLVFGLGAFAFLQYSIHKGDEQLHMEHPDIAETGRTIVHDGKTYEYNDNIVAILVLGKDDERSYGIDRSCSDANMLVTMDTETKEMNVISIPRDAMVNVDLYENGNYVRTGQYQLATAYGVDVPTDDAAARNSLKSVSGLLFNLPISRYFVLEFDAVGELSSAVGGVQVEALSAYPGASFEAGDTVLLEGQSALMYVKYRDINVDMSAQHRQDRQIQFVRAFLDKLRTLDAGSLIDLYNTVRQSTYTNLEFSDITYLISVFLDGTNSNTNYMTIQGETKLEPDDDGIEREHVYLDENSVMEAALKAFYTQKG